jgi:hypothetical protein
MSVGLDRLSRDRLGIAPPANRPVLEFIVQTAAPDDDIVGLLNGSDQSFENVKELVLAIETCTPSISSTVIGNE